MTQQTGLLMFKAARFAVFSLLSLVSLAWISLFGFLFATTFAILGRTQRAMFLAILLTYGLCLLPFYFMPVFRFPLWVEGTLVVVLLLCQVAGTMALCLRFNPDIDCRRAQNRNCRPTSDVVLYTGCGLCALLLLYLVLLVAVSRMRPFPRGSNTEIDVELADEPMFGCRGKDLTPHSSTPNLVGTFLPHQNQPKPKDHVEQPGQYPQAVPYPRTDISNSACGTNEGQYTMPGPANSPMREQFRWSRRRSRRKSDMQDVSDARSIASTTKQLIEYYRLQSGLGTSGTRSNPIVPETPQVPSVPPLPRPPLLLGTKSKRPSKRFSRGRLPKVSRSKTRVKSAVPTVPSLYSQESMETGIDLPRPPSPVATSWQAEALASAGLVYGYPELSAERRGSTTPLIPVEYPSSASPASSAVSRIPASRKRSIVERAKGRLGKLSVGSEGTSRWI